MWWNAISFIAPAKQVPKLLKLAARNNQCLINSAPSEIKTWFKFLKSSTKIYKNIFLLKIDKNCSSRFPRSQEKNFFSKNFQPLPVVSSFSTCFLKIKTKSILIKWKATWNQLKALLKTLYLIKYSKWKTWKMEFSFLKKHNPSKESKHFSSPWLLPTKKMNSKKKKEWIFWKKNFTISFSISLKMTLRKDLSFWKKMAKSLLSPVLWKFLFCLITAQAQNPLWINKY